MAKIHLIVGFMGFGKTTLAKKLARELPAIRFTHDEFMQKLYSRHIPDAEFRVAYEKIDDLIWSLAKQAVNAGVDVILDYGFWSKEDRRLAFEQAKKITDNVVFHQLNCDVSIARVRVLDRTNQKNDELFIDEYCFDLFLEKYSQIESCEGYEVIHH